MPATRFALVNVGSAFVWAAVHLLPAISLGRGLQVATAVNPRVAILAGLGAAAAVLAWVLWPSDVVAGMLFGGAMVCGFALLMHARVVTLPRRLLAGLLTVTLLGVMPLHVWTGWSAATARYDATPPLITLAATDWRSSGWQNEPANRVLLDGEPGEPMLLQTFRPLADLVTALKAAEWNASQVTLAGEIQSAVVPSRQTLDLRAPWPMTHLGRSAMATLTKSGTADTRLVLRIWATQTVIRDGTSVSPLLLVSLTADRLDPLTFGYAQLEETPLGTDRLATERTGLFAAIARIGGEASGIVELPLVAAP